MGKIHIQDLEQYEDISPKPQKFRKRKKRIEQEDSNTVKDNK